ncbi:MAG: hypothetical protein IJV82_02245 [Oscillospiraceae bacterium]|nr:hypothetical protein [Oscillospiraceae bacterium]
MSVVGLSAVEALATAVQEAVHPDANVIFSLRRDAVESNDLQVLIIATALEIDK